MALVRLWIDFCQQHWWIFNIPNSSLSLKVKIIATTSPTFSWFLATTWKNVLITSYFLLIFDVLNHTSEPKCYLYFRRKCGNRSFPKCASPTRAIPVVCQNRHNWMPRNCSNRSCECFVKPLSTEHVSVKCIQAGVCRFSFLVRDSLSLSPHLADRYDCVSRPNWCIRPRFLVLKSRLCGMQVWAHISIELYLVSLLWPQRDSCHLLAIAIKWMSVLKRLIYKNKTWVH